MNHNTHNTHNTNRNPFKVKDKDNKDKSFYYNTNSFPQLTETKEQKQEQEQECSKFKDILNTDYKSTTPLKLNNEWIEITKWSKGKSCKNIINYEKPLHEQMRDHIDRMMVIWQRYIDVHNQQYGENDHQEKYGYIDNPFQFDEQDSELINETYLDDVSNDEEYDIYSKKFDIV